MSIENGMNGALRWHPDVAVQSANQKLTDFARSPMRLVAFGVDNEAFELLRQLVGIPQTIVQGLEPVLLVTIEDFVAGLARDPELAKQPGDKPQAFLHDRTLLPRQRHLPYERGKCYPCVRYEMSAMSRAAESLCREPDLRTAVESAGGLPAGSMGDNKQPEENAPSPDQEEAEELRRILLSDD